MQPLPNLQEKPSQEEIDRVDAWREQERVQQYSEELEQIDDEEPGLVYKGFKISAEIAFSKKALIGLAKLSAKQLEKAESRGDVLCNLDGPWLDSKTSDTKKA